MEINKKKNYINYEENNYQFNKEMENGRWEWNKWIELKWNSSEIYHNDE